MKEVASIKYNLVKVTGYIDEDNIPIYSIDIGDGDEHYYTEGEMNSIYRILNSEFMDLVRKTDMAVEEEHLRIERQISEDVKTLLLNQNVYDIVVKGKGSFEDLWNLFNTKTVHNNGLVGDSRDCNLASKYNFIQVDVGNNPYSVVEFYKEQGTNKILVSPRIDTNSINGELFIDMLPCYEIIKKTYGKALDNEEE